MDPGDHSSSPLSCSVSNGGHHDEEEKMTHHHSLHKAQKQSWGALHSLAVVIFVLTLVPFVGLHRLLPRSEISGTALSVVETPIQADYHVHKPSTTERLDTISALNLSRTAAASGAILNTTAPLIHIGKSRVALLAHHTCRSTWYVALTCILRTMEISEHWTKRYSIVLCVL